MSEWITTGEAAALIGRSRRDIARMLDDERHEYFPGAYRRAGGHWRIPRESVDRFLEARQRAAQAVRRRRSGQENQDKG
jgi:excisionase family DNA binding protein